jgi:hypothetical protein
VFQRTAPSFPVYPAYGEEPMTQKKFKAILQNFSLLLLAFGVCFLLGELTVRILYKETVPLFPRYQTNATYGEFRLRRIRPNSVFWHTSVDGSWKFETNDQGFRNRQNFAYEKPNGVVRILSLGDSHTQGFEVRQDFTYSAVIEKDLSSRGYKVEVLNTGVSGFSTAEELAFLENEGVKYDPDVVVLGFYANDYEDNIKAGLFRLSKDGRLRTAKRTHLPGIRTQDLIYSLPLIPWLSENSYFYSILFNNTWRYFKSKLARDSQAAVHEYAVPAKNSESSYEVALANVLLERMYKFCHDRDIALVIIDIPRSSGEGIASSINPSMQATMSAYSDAYIDSKILLDDYSAIAEIHRPNGHRHISEFTHIILGSAAAKRIDALLGRRTPM